MFGYHAGGWGKPPVDENGKPLYGDVFGTQSDQFKVSLLSLYIFGVLELVRLLFFLCASLIN